MNKRMFLLAAIGTVGGAAAIATNATIKKKKDDEEEKIERITQLLNEATVCDNGYCYILDTMHLRKYGDAYIDMHRCEECRYAPLDMVYDIDEQAGTSVSCIDECHMFNALTIQMKTQKVIRYLLFMFVSGQWVCCGSPYEYDKGFTEVAHRISWDCIKPLRRANQHKLLNGFYHSKCRVKK